MMQLIQMEEFMSMVPSECIKTNALERISNALKLSVVVLFMKGDPKNPVDDYNKEAVQILEQSKVRYRHFDVVSDPDVREILKEYSRFSSYPQLFVDEKFMGGLNFLRHAMEHGGLAAAIPSTEVMLPML
jgi:monothiol glutaredoxin